MLNVGDHVLVQNQTGNQPTRWDKTGKIVEVRPHNQYLVRMDGSGRVSIRNRRFLRHCFPFVADAKSHTSNFKLPGHSESSPTTNRGDSPSAAQVTSPIALPKKGDSTASDSVDNPASTCPSNDNAAVIPVTPTVEPTSLTNPQDTSTNTNNVRRSKRVPQPRRTISIAMSGKSHNYQPVQPLT